jgi:hypothetical protein
MGIEKCSVIQIVIRTWSGEHVIDWKSLGVDQKILDKHRNLLGGGSVKLLPEEWRKRIRAAQQKLSDCPSPFGSKLCDTARQYLVPDAAMPALLEDWEKKQGEYQEVIGELRNRFSDVQNERLKQLISLFEDVAKTKNLGEAFVSASLGECKKKYPEKGNLFDVYRAELRPSELMALFPTKDTIQAINDLEKMGSDLRHKFIELAKIDAKCLETAHRLAWREQIVEFVASLKEAAQKGDIKGQTIRGVRTTLSRHKLSDYFGESGLQKKMDVLLGLLPDGVSSDYETASSGTLKNKILLTIKDIEEEIGKGNPALKKAAENLESQSEARLRRIVRI